MANWITEDQFTFTLVNHGYRCGTLNMNNEMGGVAMMNNGHTRQWHSACGESGDCVEVCFEGENVLVRGSREPDGPVLTFSQQEWSAFCAAIVAGRFTG